MTLGQSTWAAVICAALVCAGPGARAATILIFDGSRSMAETLGDGTRLNAAKSALNQIVQQTSQTAPDHPMGLLAFYEGCWVHNMVPIAPIRANADVIARNVAHINTEKYGHTPILRSLELAAEALGTDGGSIVLISDGEESCDPGRDLCAFAAGLADRGITLDINVIGVALSDVQARLFSCVAESTGGTFAQAENEEELSEALTIVIEEAVEAHAPPRCYDNRGGLIHRWCPD